MPRVNYFSPFFFPFALLSTEHVLCSRFSFFFFFKESIVRVIFGTILYVKFHFGRRRYNSYDWNSCNKCFIDCVFYLIDLSLNKCNSVSLSNFDK